MLQRIQTLFLLAACGLLATLFFVPMCRNAGGATEYSDLTGVLIILVLAVLLPAVTLFLYRWRTLQIRLCGFTGVVLIGFQGLIAYYFFTMDAAFSVTAIFPLVAAILTFIASRYIAHDEALVRAADRLR